MANFFREYILSWRSLVLIAMFFILYGKGFMQFIDQKKSETKLNQIGDNTESLKKSATDLKEGQAGLKQGQTELKDMVKQVLDKYVTAKEEWISLDLSSAVPPVTARAAMLLFKSKGGIVKGYVMGTGYEEEYPFDTSVNNKIVVALKIKEPKIKYRIIAPKDKDLPFAIFVAGYQTNLWGISTE